MEAGAADLVQTRWLCTEDNVADILTKSLDRKRFVRLRAYMMNEAADSRNRSEKDMK